MTPAAPKPLGPEFYAWADSLAFPDESCLAAPAPPDPCYVCGEPAYYDVDGQPSCYDCLPPKEEP